MSKITDLYHKLSEFSYVTGKEYPYYTGRIPSPFDSLDARLDASGNIIVEKTSEDENAKTILLEAHLDHIGFCVCNITKSGFLEVAPCGGIDCDLVPGTEFIVHGKKNVFAIGTSIPPHLLKKIKETDPKKSPLYLDCGFISKESAERVVSIGDPISFAAPCLEQNGRIIAPYLDNKASVISLILALETMKSKHHLIFAFTVGEESNSRGVKSFSFDKKIDLALVLDAGFARFPGLDVTKCIQMGKGPSISISDTLSRKAALWIQKLAGKRNLSLQTVCEPGGTGTSATALQLLQGGIPTAVISIPLAHMHTQSESVFESDINETVSLISAVVEEVSDFENT